MDIWLFEIGEGGEKMEKRNNEIVLWVFISHCAKKKKLSLEFLHRFRISYSLLTDSIPYNFLLEIFLKRRVSKTQVFCKVAVNDSIARFQYCSVCIS